MLLFGAFLWVSVLLALFGLLHGLRLRSTSVRNLVHKSSKPRSFEFGDSNDDIFKENEPSKLVFKFQYQTQTCEDFTEVPEEAADDASLDSLPSTTSNKYEFNSGNGFSCFVERPEEVQQVAAEAFLFEEDFTSTRSSTETDVSDNAGKEAEAEPTKSLLIEQETCRRFEFLSEKDFLVLVSDSASDGFLSDKDFEEAMEHEEDIEWEKQQLIEKDLEFSNKKSENEDIDDSRTNSTQQETASNTKNSDLTRLETLWEHQELIEQLKGELKKVRGTSLPTILEESEYPKIMEDLKPLKISDKCHHDDKMSELHKLYKRYRERMRKLDVLSYLKMYPLGTVLSREALRSISGNKSSSPPATASLLSPSFRQIKRKISEADEMVRYVRDLQRCLEIVYVGQLCLSWELLKWQYERALEICESDPYQTRRYNEVAGEFQQFQVLLQRFLENEPFEGPRVQSYTNNRSSGRNFLQVPLIREDSIKDKRRTSRDENGTTSDMLVEIMEESIRIFWRFVRVDKAANVAAHKSGKGAQMELLDSADAELLREVQKIFQKKDKRLKEVTRGGNCILRKIRINEEDESSDQALCFFSQVDVKLVARVLGMSKVTRDQLLWCHGKLSKIMFVNRKLHVEPSFLLFPC